MGVCVVQYLTLHLSHLSGELDLSGFRQLGVEGGGGSSHQQLRTVIHLGDGEDETASGPHQDR